MRACVYDYGTKAFSVVSDIPVPEPGEGEVRIKMTGADINPVDTMIPEMLIRFGVVKGEAGERYRVGVEKHSLKKMTQLFRKRFKYDYNVVKKDSPKDTGGRPVTPLQSDPMPLGVPPPPLDLNEVSLLPEAPPSPSNTHMKR